MVLRHTLLLTVVGPLLAASSEKGLLRLSFLGEAYEYRPRARALARSLDDVETVEDPGAFNDLATQLGEYFSGRRRSFDLEIDLRGSEFQRRVWRSLLRIPYGRLRSYKQVARDIGRPAATRAVGQAVGDNPVAIVVPCHRVIGTNGGLVGFGGGMTLKAQLLRLEGHTLGDRPRVVAPRLF
jgi:methylated-DNA-[protein]-cysteine S-methyltransferase